MAEQPDLAYSPPEKEIYKRSESHTRSPSLVSTGKRSPGRKASDPTIKFGVGSLPTDSPTKKQRSYSNFTIHSMMTANQNRPENNAIAVKALNKR